MDVLSIVKQWLKENGNGSKERSGFNENRPNKPPGPPRSLHSDGAFATDKSFIGGLRLKWNAQRFLSLLP